MADKRDYYAVLGIEKGADESAIKKAYRQQANKNHPYVNPGDKDAEERFKEINEAYQVLSSGSGDCVADFARAKAFFERRGIEHMDIQRTTGLTPDRHYWNFVNVGTTEEPRWYYFDATHLNSADTGVSFEGSLLTEKQINAYNKVRAHFYTFDHTGYPAAATEIVTSTPKLEPYY